MSIPSISSGSSLEMAGRAESSTKKRTALGQQDFLNLFITQLKNQNPLNPLDNFQMASQLVQFNHLDFLARIHQSIESMNAFQSSTVSLLASGLIGRKVEVESQFLTIQNGKVSEGGYRLLRPGKVTIEIYDKEGQLVRILEEGWKDTSRQAFVWDGKSQGGVSQPDGRYLFKVVAVDERGSLIPVDPSRLVTVTRVAFDQGAIHLYGETERITLDEVKAILKGT